MLRDDSDYKLAFSFIPGINLTSGSRLIEKIGNEHDFFAMESSGLTMLTGLKPSKTSDTFRQELLRQAAHERAFTDNSRIHRLYFRDIGAEHTQRYPSRLALCSDAPAMLYSLGADVLGSRRMVAVVGTRHASHQGIEIVKKFVRELASAVDGLVIVSGLAYGIDVAAHRAALAEGIPTVAVVAHPLNMVYPADHRDVAAHIISAGGAIVSEYASHQAIHRGNFLARNRIIAGLCDVTVVVESDLKGGAMSTAGMARAYDRDVVAFPGRITDRYSTGTNALIASHRAELITGADDLISVMGWPSRPHTGEQQELRLELSDDQKMLLDLIREHPEMTDNDLAIHTGRPVHHLKDLLMQMEFDDLIVSRPGGCYAVL